MSEFCGNKELRLGTTECGPIPMDDITISEINGDGVLDVLMTTFETHLQYQYDKNRIDGETYAKLYEAMYEPTLRYAIELTLQKEKQVYEIEILEKQRDKLVEDIRQQVYITNTKLPAEVALINSQKEKVDSDKALVDDTRILKLPEEIKAIQADILYKQAQTALAQKQLDIADKELAIKEKELAIKEKSLELMECNRKLACAKARVEQAQIASVDEDGNPLIAVGTPLYWQNVVLEKQAAGFDRDAEQKAAKILVDTWAVRRNTNDTELPPETLDNSDINAVVVKLAQGIGANMGTIDNDNAQVSTDRVNNTSTNP